ncbi:MAG: hypothetical protein EB116_20400, partial [Betaproteobacteria bacterium]|nr:hypothetical protein [Betaproteobacteria bacterium]
AKVARDRQPARAWGCPGSDTPRNAPRASIQGGILARLALGPIDKPQALGFIDASFKQAGFLRVLAR